VIFEEKTLKVDVKASFGVGEVPSAYRLIMYAPIAGSKKELTSISGAMKILKSQTIFGVIG
jgi:hypothetical protein